ncbi:AF4/FMR2 family member 4 isoform X5 [Vespula squamosa]|uniref:AF4/FMR2 family member 4 isoform X5 n=1 Tax=Vespula squamosa TaxID=30214 RepID=A0ABD2B2E6_VESSQ
MITPIVRYNRRNSNIDFKPFDFIEFKISCGLDPNELNEECKAGVENLERDRLRERERQARAAMSVQAEHVAAGGSSDPRHHHHSHHSHAHHHGNTHSSASLFRAPVKRSKTRSIFEEDYKIMDEQLASW